MLLKKKELWRNGEKMVSLRWNYEIVKEDAGCFFINYWFLLILADINKWPVVSFFSRSVMSYSLWPHELKPSRLLCPGDFSGKNTGVEKTFPSPGDLPNPGTEPRSPALQADSLPSEPPGKPTHDSPPLLNWNLLNLQSWRGKKNTHKMLCNLRP